MIKKFEKDTDNKMNDTRAELKTKINKVNRNLEQLTINNTAELCNHTKHIANQKEALIDETEVTRDDLRDDICIMKSDHDKKLKNINFSVNSG